MYAVADQRDDVADLRRCHAALREALKPRSGFSDQEVLRRTRNVLASAGRVAWDLNFCLDEIMRKEEVILYYQQRRDDLLDEMDTLRAMNNDLQLQCAVLSEQVQPPHDNRSVVEPDPELDVNSVRNSG